MKAIAVFPGKPNSVHLAELSKPSVDEETDFQVLTYLR
jgi:hypothetical protein